MIINKYNLSASFQDRIVEILTKKTMKAVKEYNVKQLLLAGGVSANAGIREKFSELCKKDDIELVVPDIKYCTDNAAMIAAAGYYLFKENKFSSYNLKIEPGADIC